MIDSVLYLPDYPIGHLIAFQIEQQMRQGRGTLGPEFERMAKVGNVAPDIWMEKATGAPVGAKALLTATEKALAVGDEVNERRTMASDQDDTAEMPTLPESTPMPVPGTSSLVTVDLAALSDPGKIRTNNEDHYFVGRFQRSMRTLSTNVPRGTMPDIYDETVYAMLVADGVGGSAAGEIASRTAIQALVDLVLETPDWIMLLDDRLAEEVLQRMERRFQRVRDTLVERANADPSLHGMGTTMTVAASVGPELLTAHVGDSRAYVFRHDGRLERLTRDQTMAQSLADSGAITPGRSGDQPLPPRADQRARDARSLRPGPAEALAPPGRRSGAAVLRRADGHGPRRDHHARARGIPHVGPGLPPARGPRPGKRRQGQRHRRPGPLSHSRRLRPVPSALAPDLMRLHHRPARPAR